VLKRWGMATAALMAALRTTALGDCGDSSSNKEGCCNSRDKDDDNGNNSMVTIALVALALAIAHFVTRHVIVNAVARVVALPVSFVSVQQRGQWQLSARVMAMAAR
jgi:hypothetical protein